MPRTAATPEQRLQTRDKIRAAAAAVYEEKGAAGASARAIAIKAGVSVGTLYSYYANLPELMRSLWAEPVAEEMDRLRTAVQASTDALDAIRLLLEGYGELGLARPDILRGAFLFVRQGDASTLPPAPAALEFEHLLRDAVQQGQMSDQIKSGNPQQIAHQLWAGVHGALALPINIESLDFGPAEEMATTMIEALIESIKA